MRSTTLSAMILVALVSRPQPALAAPPGGWEDWVPESATAVLVIDAAVVNGSPLAAKEGWGKRFATGIPMDVTSLPNGMGAFLAASDLSPRTLDGTWRVALFDMTRPQTPADLAARSGGRVDTIRGRQVVVSPRNVVLVPTGGSRVAARSPADRQSVSRWLPEGRGKTTGPSAFLRDSVARAQAPVVAALDLTDAVDAVALRTRLEGAAALAGRQPAERDAMARVLAGIKGVILSARVTDGIDAELRLEFSESAAPLGPILLPLVQAALQSAGAELDDLASWSARVDGNAGVLSGKLTEQSFRLALSPFFPTESASYSALPPAEPTTAGEDPKKAATFRYFTGLNELVDQLRTMKGLSVESRIRWYHEYAHKINGLPILNVDPEALQLGADISTTLRNLANAAGNFANWRIAVNQNRVSGMAQTGYSNYGYVGGYNQYGAAVGVGYSAPATAMVNNHMQINNLLAVNSTTEMALRADTWKNINDAVAAMRRTLTMRYAVEFPPSRDPAPKK